MTSEDIVRGLQLVSSIIKVVDDRKCKYFAWDDFRETVLAAGAIRDIFEREALAIAAKQTNQMDA